MSGNIKRRIKMIFKIVLLLLSIGFAILNSYMTIYIEYYYWFFAPMIINILVLCLNIIFLIISGLILLFRKKKIKLLNISLFTIILCIVYVAVAFPSKVLFQKKFNITDEKLLEAELDYEYDRLNNGMISTSSYILTQNTTGDKLFNKIKEKCYSLDTTYFLDYLSGIDYSKLNEAEYILVCVMRDFNIALDPLFRGAPKEAIKQLTKLCDEYNFDVVKKYVDVDAKTSIKSIEQMLIYRNDYRKDNHIYFGRLNNSTPISFEVIDKIGNDYLLLQDSVFDLQLYNDDVYNDGLCKLRNNGVIKKCFEIEDDLIKDIYIFSEKDYNKYRKSSKTSIRKYLDVQNCKAEIIKKNGEKKLVSYNCEKESKPHEEGYHNMYWIKDDYNEKANKIYDYNKIDIAYTNYNQKAGVRLAILVKGIGDLNEK